MPNQNYVNSTATILKRNDCAKDAGYLPKVFCAVTRRACSRRAKCTQTYMSDEANAQQSDCAKDAGYTLIELLISLSLLTLLTLIPLQSYQHIKTAHETKAVLNHLITLIRYARSAAIRSGHPVILCKSNNEKSCQGRWSDGQIVLINTEKPHVLLSFGQIKTGQLTFRGFQSSDFLRFDSNGATLEQNGSFHYQPNQANQPIWTLMIEKSGRMRMIGD